MNKEEVVPGFDGLMLGDGGLWRQGNLTFFVIASSKGAVAKKNHLKWLTWVKNNILTPQGLEVVRGYPKTHSRGEPVLETVGSDWLNLAWDEWYAGGEWRLHGSGRSMYIRGAYKKLPNRIKRMDYRLSPMDLAVWDMGDGSRSGSEEQPLVSFSTSCFLPEEVALLTWLLESQYGLVTCRPGYERPKFQERIDAGRGLGIRLARESINKYIDIVEPYILEFCKDHVGPSFKDQKLKHLGWKPKPYSPGKHTVHNIAFIRYELEFNRLRSGLDPAELNHPRAPVKPSLDELRRRTLNPGEIKANRLNYNVYQHNWLEVNRLKYNAHRRGYRKKQKAKEEEKQAAQRHQFFLDLRSKLKGARS